MKDARQVIIEPIVSEKSYALLEEGVYTFKVHPTASKPEIRDAVETIFGVSVTKVNTLNRKGKSTVNRRTGVRGKRPDRKPGVPVVGTMPSGPVHTRRAAEPPPQRSTDRAARRAAPGEAHPSTGPIPVVRPEQFEDADDLDSTPRESALAWLRFAGELIIALAAGVGVYFAATLLWENVPHVAVLLAPLAVTALVAGVGYWRQKQGRDPVGPRLLAILVFAGTLLTIAPAAGLLAGGG